jgi:hypothetical protein
MRLAVNVWWGTVCEDVEEYIEQKRKKIYFYNREKNDG